MQVVISCLTVPYVWKLHRKPICQREGFQPSLFSDMLILCVENGLKTKNKRPRTRAIIQTNNPLPRLLLHIGPAGQYHELFSEWAALLWESPCWIQQDTTEGQRWGTSSLLTAGHQNSSITPGNYSIALIYETLMVGYTNINEWSKRNLSLFPHLTGVKAIQHQSLLSLSAWSLSPEPCRLSLQVTVGFISFQSASLMSFWCGIHTQVSMLVINQMAGTITTNIWLKSHK